MTETREQFVERIAQISFGLSVEALRAPEATTMGDVAIRGVLAGYTEALWDVLREFGHIVRQDDGLLADDIHAWAYNQMGIDLTDEMKAMFPDDYDNNKGAQL